MIIWLGNTPEAGHRSLNSSRNLAFLSSTTWRSFLRQIEPSNASCHVVREARFYWLLHSIFKFVACNTQQNRICSKLLRVACNKFAYRSVRVKGGDLLHNIRCNIRGNMLHNMLHRMLRRVKAPSNVAPCEGTLRCLHTAQHSMQHVVQHVASNVASNVLQQVAAFNTDRALCKCVACNSQQIRTNPILLSVACNKFKY